MGDVVNLNRFRKRKAKEEKRKRADVNRRLHGRTKAERAREAAAKERLDKQLDGARLIRSRDVEPSQPELVEAALALDPAEALAQLERAVSQAPEIGELEIPTPARPGGDDSPESGSLTQDAPPSSSR